MAAIEIVQPRRSDDVVSKLEGLWILPQAWETPAKAEMGWMLCAGRFPHLLGRASPAHRLHRPDNTFTPNTKPDTIDDTNER